MKRILLCLAVLVLVSGSALADTELLSNGDFESGVLSPWYNARNFCGQTCQTWTVNTTNPHSGTYSAMDIGNIELRQDFTPTPGSQITNISFWVNSQAGVDAIDFFYTDSSDEEFVVFPTANVWTLENVTSNVNTGKTLMGFSIWGADPNWTTFVDDASITATGVPEPSTLVMLGGGALAVLGKLSRRLKG